MTAERANERTIHVAGDLHQALRLVAAVQRTTVKALAEQLLRKGVQRLMDQRREQIAAWITTAGQKADPASPPTTRSRRGGTTR